MDVVLKYFLLFIIYSFCGWLLEVIIVSVASKKWSARGFLIGPICPIYGLSSICMTILLNKYKNDYLVLFFMSVIICSIIEYLTSFLMEKIFKTRWWDYSHKSFNLNGRICLTNSFLFGILGLVVIIYLNPFFLNIINRLPCILLNLIATILTIILIIDTFISFNIICKVKVAADNIRKDYTEEINEKIRKFIKESSFLYKRLFKAFPNLNLIIKIKSKRKNKDCK